MSSDYYAKYEAKTIEKWKSLKKTGDFDKEYLIELWHVRNSFRWLVCKRSESNLLLEQLMSSMSDEEKFLMEVFDDIYELGIDKGLWGG